MSPKHDTSLQTRWLERLRQMGSQRIARIAEDLRDGQMGWEMWMDQRDPAHLVDTSLCPLLVDPATRGYLHHAAWQMRRAVRRVGELAVNHQEVREILGIPHREAEWFGRYGEAGLGGDTRFCRLDAVFESGDRRADSGPRGRPARLQFIEVNVVGIGGMGYACDTAELLRDRVMPWVARGKCGLSGDDWAVEPLEDPRALLQREIRDLAGLIGLPTDPRVVVLDSREEYESDGEDRRTVEWLRERGMDVEWADPRMLEPTGLEGVQLNGRPVDVIYRMVDVPDLAALQRDGADLRGLHRAFEQGRVLPGILGDLDHKSVFELMTDPGFRHHFTGAQQEVFQRHVLWTRLLSMRRTSGPDGRAIELPAWVRDHRESLVLKPNRGYGGDRVTLGRTCDADAWDEVVDRALASDEAYVVQKAAASVTQTIPTAGEGLTEHHANTVIGLFPSRYGLGVLGRYAGDPVVNISRGGGILPVMVDFS